MLICLFVCLHLFGQPCVVCLFCRARFSACVWLFVWTWLKKYAYPSIVLCYSSLPCLLRTSVHRVTRFQYVCSVLANGRSFPSFWASVSFSLGGIFSLRRLRVCNFRYWYFFSFRIAHLPRLAILSLKTLRVLPCEPHAVCCSVYCALCWLLYVAEWSACCWVFCALYGLLFAVDWRLLCYLMLRVLCRFRIHPFRTPHTPATPAYPHAQSAGRCQYSREHFSWWPTQT